MSPKRKNLWVVTAVAVTIALLAAACGGDEEDDTSQPPPPPPAEEPEAPPAPPAEAGGPSDAPGGPFTLNVGGTGYAMPGPSGGILGGLPPDLVFPWTYNFDTATFEAGSSPAAPFDPSIRTASQDYEIAWVSGWAALEFSQFIEDSIVSTAAASGVHMGVICDSEYDPEKALSCAATVAETNPDAVVFGNWRNEAANSSMEVFNNAGIPVITIDVWHPNAIFFGANNYVSGALAGVNTGLYALETWNCDGVHVLLGQNLTAGEAPDLRVSGFADGVQAVCGGDVPVDRIDVDGSPENGLQSTTDWLTANPGAEHVLATSLDDVVAVPMSRAMEQAGRSGVAAGHGAEPNGVERLNEDTASETRYLGSVAYFPELYGVYAVAALIDILDGRAVPQEIHIDHVFVNRDNVGEYYDPEGQPIHNLGPSTEPAATATDTGSQTTITLAVNPWNGSAVNVAVAAQLLEDELGYTVETVDIDENAQWAAINTGEIDGSLEVWPSGHAGNRADFIDSADGNVDDAGLLGPVGKIGWFMPTYMVDQYPALATWEGLADPELAAMFATAETGDKGQYLGGDPSWTIYDPQIIENLGLNFEIVYVGSETGILAALDAAYNREEPILFYFWTPHSAFNSYDLTNVKLPEYNDECYASADAGGVDCDYPADDLFKIVNRDLKNDAPAADALLRNMNYAAADQISMLAAVELDGASIEEAAAAWIAANASTWQAWLP